MTRREALVLRAFAVWTVFVWVVFVRNVIGDDKHDFGFKAVHTLLAVISVAFAVIAWQMVSKVRHRERHPVDE
jgi:Na+/melibiose symporter-like transporter